MKNYELKVRRAKEAIQNTAQGKHDKQRDGKLDVC